MAVHRPDRDLLARQLRSLQDQTLRDWQCLVGLDGPDDQTYDVLRNHVAGDTRFQIERYAHNVGVYRHFERMLKNVPEGFAWVALCDQDDYWYANKLEVMTGMLSEHVSAATCQARVVDRNGTVLAQTHRRSGDLGDLLIRNQVTGGLTVLRPDVVARALPFPQATSISLHDHWLGVCAASVGEVSVSDVVLQDYVQHDSNALGEAPETTVLGELGRLSGTGVRAKLDHLARERWGWRVIMARTLVARVPSPSRQSFVEAVARGSLSRPVVAGVWRSARRGHIRWRQGAGVLLAAFWWPHQREAES